MSTPQELREEVDATRRELAATVEQLAAKTAVKARLHHRVEDAQDELRHIPGRITARGRRIASSVHRVLPAAAIGGAAIVLLIGWTLSQRSD